METKDYEQLIKKLDAKKNQKAKIEGAIEQVQKGLEENYGLKTDSDIKNKLDDIDLDIKKNQLKKDELVERLDKIVDWKML